ncbi:MAG: xanthan lyase [Paludibacteraceae bacterium]|nr:xanthan lyase [Paludibacteraceae bacterium]
MSKWVRILMLVVATTVTCSAKAEPTDAKTRLTEWLQSYCNDYLDLQTARIKKLNVDTKTKTISIYTNFIVGTLPFRPDLVEQMQREAAAIVADDYPNYRVVIYADGKKIDTLIPAFYQSDYTPGGQSVATPAKPVIKPLSCPYTTDNALTNRNIALWHSHGWYFDTQTDRWHWQRARYFETVEDKLTASFVLPFLLPMIEHAGANVFLPQERDVQSHEVLVDNDNDNINFGSLYCETGGDHYFASGANGSGFRQRTTPYRQGENPFTEGTARLLKTSLAEEAFAEWVPDIPVDGDYMVSVAYPFTESNVSDAHYTVYHAGGRTDFQVNQTMACGTWVYLGCFHFKKGLNADSARVVLSNRSRHNGVVAADVVRFGGGMGNVARSVSPDAFCRTSGRPRCMEAAAYWLQWAGAPETVYHFSESDKDYTDDISARGLWVNWMNGGSDNAPAADGLRVPIDVALGLHSDAGCKSDTIIGTLGIYSSADGRQTRFPNGRSRAVCRDLADYVTMSLVDDMRRAGYSDWSFRGLWDKQYGETRRPEVPAMLLEMFSHQSFVDMRFALDPRFRFMASRAVYKGLLRFLSVQHGSRYVVQPLPVTAFAAQLLADTVQLSWSAVPDTLEPTAQADAYIVYTRIDDGGFDNGILVHDTMCRLPIEPDKIYSYKVEAVNAGGASFPSEILSVCRNSTAKHTVLIVNGFERTSAPEGFDGGAFAGFPDFLDDAVPYISDISYVGAQHEFRRSEPWTDDDAPGWGASNSDYDADIVAGNTFDFPIVHGRALRHAGYSFASCSGRAIERGSVALSDYRAVDWILGEQKRCRLGTDTTRWEFRTFSAKQQRHITDFCLQGGALLVSGAYVGTDLWKCADTSEADRAFAKTILKYQWRTDHAAQDGSVKCVATPKGTFSGNYNFCNRLNSEQYAVESPDGIEPADAKAFTAMRYSRNNISAAVAYSGIYRTFVCGFPLEALTSDAQRQNLVQQIMLFLTE